MNTYYLIEGVLYNNNGQELAKVAEIEPKEEGALRQRLEAAGLVRAEDQLIALL